MYSPFMVLILTLLCLDSAVFVNAALYIVEPFKGSTCQGGQPCTVTWLDDGAKPLLSAIGVSRVGLYYGKQQLVQTITPVDVANVHTITFTPLPAAGPDFDAYYIAFASTQFVGNDSIPYSGYSPFFSLTGMSGSFDSPLPSATSSIPILPSSLPNSSTFSETSTVTVGTLSTSLSPSSPGTLPAVTTATLPSLISTSRLSTSIIPTSTSRPISTSTTSSLAPTSSTAGASGSASHLPGPLYVLLLAISSSAFFFL